MTADVLTSPRSFITWFASSPLRLCAAAAGAILLVDAGGTDDGPGLCIFRRCTGGYCPGCGLTRSAKHLSRGEFGAAWHDHPWLVLVAAQMIIAGAVLAVFRQLRARFDPARVALVVGLANVVLVFWRVDHSARRRIHSPLLLMSNRATRREASVGIHFAGAGVTHVGGVREHNEDSFSVGPKVCVVADGMGGHEAGEVASQLVTRLIVEHFAERVVDIADLPRLVSRLNSAVQREGVENGTPGMGTTTVGVAIADNGESPSAVVFNVGDSRCYRLAGGVMTQLTRDHSHVQELVEAGQIRADEAETHPLRNVITRALGSDESVEADFYVLPEEDCRLLLCSDGLTGEVDEDRLWDQLTHHPEPEAAAAALVAAALEGRASDNITALVIDIRHGGAEALERTVSSDGDDTEEIDPGNSTGVDRTPDDSIEAR